MCHLNSTAKQIQVFYIFFYLNVEEEEEGKCEEGRIDEKKSTIFIFREDIKICSLRCERVSIFTVAK